MANEYDLLCYWWKGLPRSPTHWFRKEHLLLPTTIVLPENSFSHLSNHLSNGRSGGQAITERNSSYSIRKCTKERRLQGDQRWAVSSGIHNTGELLWQSDSNSTASICGNGWKWYTMFGSNRWSALVGKLEDIQVHNLVYLPITYLLHYKLLYHITLPSDLPVIPVMALTATATPATKLSLMNMLRNPVTQVGSVSKPNIYLKAIELPSLFPKPGKYRKQH